MKQSKAAKVNDQHPNGHVSLFKLAKLFDSEASWDKDPTEQTGINNFMVQQLNGLSMSGAGASRRLMKFFQVCNLLCVIQCAHGSASL